MSITRKNAGGIIPVPVKADAVINAGDFVCADSSGFAVPGANTSGLKFLGVAKNGVDATGLDSGDLNIFVYTRGQFLKAATSIAQGNVGSPMYINGPATFDDTTSNLIMCGLLIKFIGGTSGWVDINASGAGPAVASNNMKAVSASKTTSREENVAGLSSAITLANDLKTKINAHAADAGEHATAIDNVNFPVAGTATDLASLKVLAGLLLTAYAAHHVDARLAAAWAFHAAQGSNYALVSAVTPVTLQEAITRLNDLKAKYDLHDDDDTAHDTLADHAVAAANGAYGVAILVPAVGVASGDAVFWDILDDGTGNVTKGAAGAVAGTDSIVFNFSADPQNDTVIQYMAVRP